MLIPVFLSTPSARRATAIDVSGQIGRQISIHALREEGDLSASYYYTFSKISIHALREEGDQEQLLAEINRRRFLSTPSARRATCSPLCRLCTPRHFYPRPPRGGRRVPRTRRPQPVHFYPRPPRGGRRVFLDEDQSDILISIHALREEGDRVRFLRSSQRHNFYPRPPRGGRRFDASEHITWYLFLSTPSARRATSCKSMWCRAGAISIHALREEGDPASLETTSHSWKFLSTPSARRATRQSFLPRPAGLFLSTPSARRATSNSGRIPDSLENFYPRPPRGGRPERRLRRMEERDISIHALREEGDLSAVASAAKFCAISIHALREEGDGVWIFDGLKCTLFLSTPSARRATMPMA